MWFDIKCVVKMFVYFLWLMVDLVYLVVLSFKICKVRNIVLKMILLRLKKVYIMRNGYNEYNEDYVTGCYLNQRLFWKLQDKVIANYTI